MAVPPLTVLLVVRHATGSNHAAGAAVAIVGISTAAGNPLLGMLIDRFSAGMVLRTTAVIHTIGCVTVLVAALGHRGGVPAMFAGCVVLGLAQPPFGLAVRSTWAAELGDDPALLDAAYSLDAAFVEASFLVGPIFIAAAGAAGSLSSVLLGEPILGLLGAAVFRGVAPGRRRTVRQARQLFPAVRSLKIPLGIVFAFGVADGLVQVAVPLSPAVRARASIAGLLFATMSLGSLVSALERGRRHPRRSSLFVQLLGFTAALGVLQLSFAFAPNLGVLAALMLAGGAALGPLGAINAGLVQQLAPTGTSGSGFGWMNAFLAAGFSIGSATAGTLHAAPALLLAGATTLCSAGAGFAACAASRSGG